MALNDEAKLDHKFLALSKQLNLYLSHFPSHEKYGLALQIRTTLYDVYAIVVECQKRYQKKTSLTNLDIRHEQLRMLIRMAHELGYFGFENGSKAQESRQNLAEHRYLAISRMIDEIGRMIGGWIAADRNKAIREMA